MEFPPDIVARIDSDFGVASREQIQNQLQSLNPPPEVAVRLVRCILFLADSSADRLAHNLKCAQSDYRDVLFWAECDENDERVRDFNLPFA